MVTKRQRIFRLLKRIKLTIATKNKEALHFTDSSLMAIADLLTSIAHGPYVIRKSVSTALKSIANKLRHRRNIGSDIGVLQKLANAIIRLSISTRYITTGSYVLAGFLKLTGKTNAIMSSRYKDIYVTWMGFVKLLSLIQLVGLGLTLYQMKSLANDIESLANEIA